MSALFNERGVLPIAIVAKAEDLRAHRYAPWKLAYDEVGEIMRRRHRYGEEPEWIVRRIRIDKPQDMVDGVTVPIDLRDDLREDHESRARKRRGQVEEIADRIVREGAPGVNLAVDFDLEREVLDELWKRWREVAADGFLVRALEENASTRGER